MKKERQTLYAERQKEILEKCRNCKTASVERCDECSWGKKLRQLERDFNDVTGWSGYSWKWYEKNHKK